ncbi:MAG: cytochrome c biogenesis CcdA family protein [Candidatus Bipolaricaulia bacterium]
MEIQAPSLLISFGAGLTLFFSPCIAPIIPAYLANIAGVDATALSGDASRSVRRQILKNAFAFVIGFSVLFILLGSTLGYLSGLLSGFQVWMNRIGGTLILILALHMLGIIEIPLLNRSFEVGAGKGGEKRKSYLGSTIMGASFGLGWTPCTGPILAAILAFAATTGSTYQGTILLIAFSAGLAIPFLVTGLFTSAIARWLRSSPKLIVRINQAAGAVLVALGVIIFAGRIQALIGFIL